MDNENGYILMINARELGITADTTEEQLEEIAAGIVAASFSNDEVELEFEGVLSAVRQERDAMK